MSNEEEGFVFFFKQKTAYEIYQCDWSSDVCSSDLVEYEGKTYYFCCESCLGKFNIEPAHYIQIHHAEP